MAPSLHTTRARRVHLSLVASLLPRLLYMCREVCRTGQRQAHDLTVRRVARAGHNAHVRGYRRPYLDSARSERARGRNGLTLT